MSESNQAEPSPAHAAFAEQLRQFHLSLPPEEQQLLEQIFALAQSASAADVSGFGLPTWDFQWGVGRGMGSPMGGGSGGGSGGNQPAQT